MIPNEAISVRPFDKSADEAFIFSTWLRNYKHSSYFAKRIRPAVFFAGHHKIVEFILGKPNTRVLIAHPKDDGATILGYLVYHREAERPTIHFAFVKDAFRKMGVFKRLIQTAEIVPDNVTFTHWTYPVDDFIRKYPDMVFNPYAF